MKLNKLTIIFVLPSLMILLGLLNVSTVSAEDNLSIHVLPEDVLFDVHNMKPGDWAPRTTTIQNNGNIEFAYSTSVEPNSDSLELYNELLLEVSDVDEELYNGKLSDFTGLTTRNLAPGEEDELEFTVRFPETLGNDYQGLDAQFTIYFTAESEVGEQGEVEEVQGTIDSGGESGGSSLPDTATNMFTLVLIGLLLLTVGGVLGFVALYKKKMKSLD